jgi:hypothetical protein
MPSGDAVKVAVREEAKADLREVELLDLWRRLTPVQRRALMRRMDQLLAGR